MRVSIPKHWTQRDVDNFLKFLKPEPEDKEERDSLRAGRSEHHCWRNDGCALWLQDGERKYQGHCKLYSSTCATAAFERRNPPRWVPKD